MTRGLIETVRVVDGAAPLWPLHLGRLTTSALALQVPLPDLDVPVGGPDRVLRYLVGRELQIEEREVGSTEPIGLITSPAPHRGYPHKSADRAWLEAARTTSNAAGGDDALLINDEGLVVEASIWAIGWWDNEALCFPPLALGGLPSVARARLGEMVRGGVREAMVTARELRRHSVLACNAARGVVPVAALDGQPLRTNHRTMALSRRFWANRNA